MKSKEIDMKVARRVTPRALKNYAQAIGYVRVPDVNGVVAVYHQPDSKLHQILIPLDEELDDYGEMVAEAAIRLSSFEGRSLQDVLDHLILPPADLLSFRDTGAGASDGTLTLNQAADLLVGARKALLAQAHTVLKPQAYHPRLSRSEAEKFVSVCRFGQTQRGSFVVTLVCPLDAVPTEDQHSQSKNSFSRQVTSSFMRAISYLAKAADEDDVDSIIPKEGDHSVISANLCEAILLLRPPDDRPKLNIGASWSRSFPKREDFELPSTVLLNRESFAAAEYLAPKLRAMPDPKPDRFVGFVDVLRGLPGPDHRPFGEVVLSILQGDEFIKARIDLDENDYDAAVRAHLKNAPVYFTGVLLRLPRFSRIDDVEDFQIVDPHVDEL